MSEPIKNRPILSAVFSAQGNSGGKPLLEALSEIAKQHRTIEINVKSLEEGGIVVATRTVARLLGISDHLLNEYSILVNVSDFKVIYLETIRKRAEAGGNYIRQTGGSATTGIASCA